MITLTFNICKKWPSKLKLLRAMLRQPPLFNLVNLNVMKNITQFFVLFFSVFIFSFIYGQTASSTCSTVSLSDVPFYPTNLLMGGSYKCFQCGNQCLNIILTPPSYSESQNYLEKKQSNGTWSSVQGPINGDIITFNSVAAGTYRIRNIHPNIFTSPGCPNGLEVRNILNQLVGYQGTYTSGSAYYSNEVFVGPVQQSQVAYEFVDSDGQNSSSLGFDYNEDVSINTTGSENQNHWWIAIFENDGPMRSYGIGWQFGTVPTDISLSEIWAEGGLAWEFEPFRSYTVQFALSNSCNTQWTNLNKTFFICPQGSGCREIVAEKAINLSPNPSTGYFRLNNMNQLKAIVSVFDVSGREVRRYNDSPSELDVSDLNNGMYTVSVIQDGKRVFTSKVAIVK